MTPRKTRARRVVRGGCVAAHARGLVADREVCATDQAYSIFLLLPRGAGSICGKLGAFLSTGVLLYVTVRVTTSRTLTRRERPVLASASQTFGEAIA